MTVYVVMEGINGVATLYGLFKNREDAEKEVELSPDFRWIEEEEVQ